MIHDNRDHREQDKLNQNRFVPQGIPDLFFENGNRIFHAIAAPFPSVQ